MSRLINIPSVNKEDKRPYYIQIQDSIRRGIIKGEIPSDAKLPPVDRWAPVIGVNTHTLNRALNNLVREGLLHRKTRMGTFVSQRHKNKTVIKKSKQTVLIIFPEEKRLESPYTQEVLKGIYDESELYNFNVEVFCVKQGRYPRSWEDFFAGRKNVHGLILDKEGFPDKHALNLLANFKGPKVIINSTFYLNRQIPSVVINYQSASFTATDYLIQKGHERIAIIIRSKEGPFIYRSDTAKLFGYKSALEKHGLKIYAEYKKEDVDDDPDKIETAAAELLALKKPPTAVFATDDVLAFKLLQILQEKKIKIPGDISIVGFYNLLCSKIASPKVTTVATPNMELGRKCFELLIAEKTEHIVLESVLLERDTVKNLNRNLPI